MHKCDTPDKCRISPNGPSMTTLAYYQPVYDGHGNNLNPDRNTTYCPMKCSTCEKEWDAGSSGDLSSMLVTTDRRLK